MNRRMRVAVMSPQTRLARVRRPVRRHWRTPRLDPAQARRARALYAAQRVPALCTIALLLALLVALPVVLSTWPQLGHIRLWGVPVSWLAVAALPFPCMIGLAWWQLRRAERIEERWW